jgi:hypothetical protein
MDMIGSQSFIGNYSGLLIYVQSFEFVTTGGSHDFG